MYFNRLAVYIKFYGAVFLRYFLAIFLLSPVAAGLFTFVVRVNGHGLLALGHWPGNLWKSSVTHDCTRAAAQWQSAARQRRLKSWGWNLQLHWMQLSAPTEH